LPPARDIANAWIAGGGNAEAFKSGPVIGEYVARRVLNKDLEPQLAATFRIPVETYEGILAPAPASRAPIRGNGEAGFDD
jgi:hypothetical protein